MRNSDGNSFRGIRLTSVDGTVYWIDADSTADYVLHPAFLRFLALVIALFALLTQRPDLHPLGGWELALVWIAVSCVVLAWLILWSPVIVRLMEKGWINQLYTPVLLMPMVLVTEMTLQSVVVLLGEGTFNPLPQTLQQAVRDMIAVTLIDILHASYVVHKHPLARTTPAAIAVAPTVIRPDTPPGTHETMTDQPPSDGPEPVDGTGMVQIGPTLLALGSILMVRTEDHYLGVTTRSGKALHRAKMADISELHSGTVGMQINRSVWIAYSAIKDVTETENRQVVVSLVTGDEERISKPRVFAFRQAYAKHLANRTP